MNRINSLPSQFTDFENTQWFDFYIDDKDYNEFLLRKRWDLGQTCNDDETSMSTNVVESLAGLYNDVKNGNISFNIFFKDNRYLYILIIFVIVLFILFLGYMIQ
jgi:hypothetical protein